MLSLIATLLVFGLVGFFIWRYIRGGGYKLRGTFQARLATALPLGVLTAILSQPSPTMMALMWLPCILFAYLCLIVSGHGEHQDMGRMPMAYTADKKPYEVLTFWLPRYNDMDPAWKRELIDFVGMTVIGCARGITLVAPICYAAPLMSAYIVTAFTLSGFGYWLGYRIPFKLPKVTMGAEWGEGLTGFFVFTVLGYFAWLRFVS